MKQIVQFFSDGSTCLVEVPVPNFSSKEILIKSSFSLLSLGTEKMLIDFGRANILDKAKQQPEKVKEVLDKIFLDGPISTLEAVTNKLNSPFPLGYSNVGTIIGIGNDVEGFEIGDRVISNGPHAEYHISTQNLCAKIPENVSDEEASFTVIGAIGLQGMRLANPTFGETFLVSGLGLIGLITAQLLKANGCNVIGIDPDPQKCKLANSLSIDSEVLINHNNIVNWCLSKTNNIGVDGVLITASTKSSEPVHLASEVTRKKGRIVQIGATGLDLKRNLFYEKELTLKVSCSYGPGRYDDTYEKEGLDYPLGYVRWTEKRNFEAILQSLKDNSLNVKSLISHKFNFENSLDAYEIIKKGGLSLGILFQYSEKSNSNKEIQFVSNVINSKNPTKKPFISFVGAGNFAKRTLVPCFKRGGGELHKISSSEGLQPFFIGRNFGFNYVTTEIEAIFDDSDCDAIVIATRHDSHFKYVKKGLERGKNIYVEKPLCLNMEELIEIEKIYFETKRKFISNAQKPPILMVGFNRRFAPTIIELKKILSKIEEPKAFIYTCNAGNLPKNHWLNNRDIGGGRMIGEACHFVDLIRFLVGHEITSININPLKGNKLNAETFSLNISFKDGSIGTINYLSNGTKSFPKERLEVFVNNQIYQINNFKTLKSWGMRRKIKNLISFQNKGHNKCVRSFIKAIRFNNSPIPENEIFEVHRFLFKLLINE